MKKGKASHPHICEAAVWETVEKCIGSRSFFQVTSRGQIDHEVDLGPRYGSSRKDCMSLPVRCVVDSSGLY